LIEVTHGLIWMHDGTKHAESRKDVPFWDPQGVKPRLGYQISQNHQY